VPAYRLHWLYHKIKKKICFFRVCRRYCIGYNSGNPNLKYTLHTASSTLTIFSSSFVSPHNAMPCGRLRWLGLEYNESDWASLSRDLILEDEKSRNRRRKQTVFGPKCCLRFEILQKYILEVYSFQNILDRWVYRQHLHISI